MEQVEKDLGSGAVDTLSKMGNRAGARTTDDVGGTLGRFS